MDAWIPILSKQPRQGQRILAKMLSGAVVILTYSKFDWACWGVVAYKPMPEQGNGQRQ
jgi:hypothetical protein